MFAKPWEKDGASEVLADAIADQTAAPWEPKPAKVARSVVVAHNNKQTRNQKSRPATVFKRQEFAKSYLIDCNPAMACLRLGLCDNIEDARKEGWRIFNEPETLAAIQAFSARLENDKIVSRERVLMGLLEEANFHGLGASHSARVAAWGRMAAMLGADKPKSDEDPAKKVRGGVMMIPMAKSIEEWESAAVGSQAQLKAVVRQ